MKPTHKSIFLLALGGFLAASLYAEGGKGEDEGQRKRGPKGGGMIKMLDKDKDGLVSKVEMMSHFDEVDSNGDGLLSSEELKAHRESLHGEMKKKREEFEKMTPEERFSKMDTDGNGMVDSSEFPRKKAFDKIDTDKSGGLSQEELKAFREKMKERGLREGKKGRKDREGAEEF